jgi:23S rRNA (uracil1939-C5)-methyltransferase
MQVTIEKLVYGGAGLARTDQGVIFVPRTAPGDVVEVELAGRKSDYANARVTSLLEASPDRQVPACPNYETAGCCHWQHIQYPRQLEIKEAILRETLQRTGRIVWEGPIPVISGPDLHYRLRATFHVVHGRLGFVEQGSHRVVPIVECSSLAPELNALLAKGETYAVRDLNVVAWPRVEVGEFVFDLHPDAFFQSNQFLLKPFMDEVLRAVGGATRVLDLFCGSGFFTIPLGKACGQVLGVESSRISVKQAKVNEQLNQKSNEVRNVEFFEGDVEETLKRSKDVRPDVVVMNPPRAGAGREVAGLVAGLGARKIVYVSCNPSTFAREAATMMGKGYALESVTMVDQFPNTYHIEMVAVLGR